MPSLSSVALQERDVAADAVDAEPAEGLEDDPVAGRGDEVLHVEVGSFLDQGVDLLARAAEVEDGFAHLVGFGPVALEKAETQDRGLDPAVDLGFAEVRPEVVDGQRLRPHQKGQQGVGGGDLDDGAGERDLEIAAGRDLDGPAAEILDDDEEGADRGEHDEEQDDQDDVRGFFHGGSSVSGSPNYSRNTLDFNL